MQRLVSLCLAGCVLVAGCSSDEGADTATSFTDAVTTASTGAVTTTVMPAPSTSAVPPATPASTSTTSTTTTTSTTVSPTIRTSPAPDTTGPPPPPAPPPAPPQTCAGEPPIRLPAEAVVTSMVAGDIDGDGELDHVQVYGLGDEWGLHAVLAHGWETDRSLAGVADTGPGTRVVGVRDIGESAALLELGGVLIGRKYGFFVLDDCELTYAPLTGSDLTEVVNGGGLMHTWWFACSAERVIQLRVTRTGEQYTDPDVLTSWEFGYETSSVSFALVTQLEREVGGSTWDELTDEFPICTEA